MNLAKDFSNRILLGSGELRDDFLNYFVTLLTLLGEGQHELQSQYVSQRWE